MLVCAALIRLIGLFVHSTMPDEAFTFFIAAHPIDQIVQLLKTGDFHPPLIYVIGHALFHLSSRAYLFRLVCVGFGVAGVAATYFVARRVVGRWALLAAFLVALNPVLVFYDGFFRMYAPLWALCMLSWAALLWAIDAPRHVFRWVAYSVCLCALLYTQYLAFFTVAAQFGYVLLTRKASRGFWLAALAALAGFALWLPVFVIQYPLGGTAYNALAGHWSQMLQAPPVLLIDGLPASVELSPIVLWLLWIALVAGFFLAIAQRTWLLLALSSPLFLQVLYSITSGKLLLGQRYLLQAIPVLVIILVNLLRTLCTGKLRIAGIALAAAFVLLTVAGTVDKKFVGSYMPLDWNTYQRFLEERVKPGDAVIFDSSMVYYVLIGSPVAHDRPVYLVTNPQEAQRYGKLAAQLPRVWLIDYQSQLPDPGALAYREVARTHPTRTTWRSTSAGYGDVVVTTLFLRGDAKRGP